MSNFYHLCLHHQIVCDTGIAIVLDIWPVEVISHWHMILALLRFTMTHYCVFNISKIYFIHTVYATYIF